jgi:predicted amino acid-binding ACT domain protein
MTRGPDRAGTIHAISAFFVEHGINIEDWQAERDGADVIYTAQLAIPDAADFRMVQNAFRTRMNERGLTATICHENIFRATNEVGPIKGLLESGRVNSKR